VEKSRRPRLPLRDVPEQLARGLAGREGPLPRSVRREQQLIQDVGQGDLGRARKSAGASAAWRARDEAPLGLGDSGRARRVPRSDSPNGAEGQEAWRTPPRAEKDARARAPLFARKALHHAWTQATPQKESPSLVANPTSTPSEARGPAPTPGRAVVREELPGMESSRGRHWAEITTEQRALSWRRTRRSRTGPGSVAEDTARGARRPGEEMEGWPLKAYQARLENAKPTVPAKTRPAPRR